MAPIVKFNMAASCVHYTKLVEAGVTSRVRFGSDASRKSVSIIGNQHLFPSNGMKVSKMDQK